MLCPYCNQEHPENPIKCPSTGKMLKLACSNKVCSYFGEHIWPVDIETCPCCGKPFSNTLNGHEFVDLGLSVKWATCNVGASKPEDFGDYFAWGETIPKSCYDSISLKYCSSNSKYTKYVTERIYGLPDGKLVLDMCDDVANTNWGGFWRMPTATEFRELINNCDWEEATLRDVSGCRFNSKLTGNSIFLPATGYREEYESFDFLSGGHYWSSSLSEHSSPTTSAWGFSFGHRWGRGVTVCHPDFHSSRCRERYLGLSVRPVLVG